MIKWPWKEVIRRRPGAPIYLTRWMLFPRNLLFNIYLHKFTEPDWSADPHDHPFSSLGLILKGRYVEDVYEYPPCPKTYSRIVSPGDIIYRSSLMAHSIVALPDGEVWTLFVRGHSFNRIWGFWRDGCRSFLPYEDYIKEHHAVVE